MVTIIIENVPKSVVKIYGSKVSYNELEIKPRMLKNDPTIRLQKMIEDPENKIYGPFNNVQDFLKHLHSNKD